LLRYPASLNKRSYVRTKATERREGSNIPRSEWDFRPVPADELETCLHYEYARDNKSIRNTVLRWRTMPEKMVPAIVHRAFVDTVPMRTEGLWRELKKLTDSTFAQLLINLPQFPETPWQEIPAKTRARCKRLITFYKDLDAIRSGARLASIEDAIHYSSTPTKNHDVIMFIAAPRGGVEMIIEDITRAVRARYKNSKSKKKHSKKKHRRSYREWLKQLGVKRLKDALKTWSAVRDYTQQTIGRALYGDNPAKGRAGENEALWRRARLAAINRTKTLFPIKRAH
jgi:hypothetical protein